MQRILLVLLSCVLLAQATRLAAQPIPGPKGSVESPSYVFDKIVFVPVASFAEAHGLQKAWDVKTQVITLHSSTLKLSFRAGSSYALVNNKLLYMSAEARMMNGELLIPLQFGLQIFRATPHTMPSQQTQPLKVIKPPQKSFFAILLDPGHGGNDVGARGKRGMNEKDINLDIAKRVRDKLQTYGIKVIMSRPKDEFITLWRRTSLAKTSRPHLFVSIHTNAARSRSVNGAEIFYYGNANFKENGPQYKQNRLKSYQFAKLVQYHLSKSAKIKSRGVKSAKYFVLRNSSAPAVLIEVGFITHAEEESRLVTTSHRNLIAQAITQAVLDFRGRK